MRAGVSKIDITPPLDRIEAYGIGYWYKRAVRFTGVRDSLFVRTLVLDNRVIISVDSIFDSFHFIPDASARIARALGIDEGNIFITCTHTHSSPLIDRNNTRCGIEYGPFVADRIVESALQAAQNSAPVTLSASAARVPGVLYNRRPLLANGRIAELHAPLSDSVVDPGPVNDTMTIVKVHRENGDLIGGLCHFGIHGVAVQCSELISSDCMGRAIQAAEKEWGDIVLLHMNGPCGDIDPAVMGDDRSLDIMTTRLAAGITDVGQAGSLSTCCLKIASISGVKRKSVSVSLIVRATIHQRASRFHLPLPCREQQRRQSALPVKTRQQPDNPIPILQRKRGRSHIRIRPARHQQARHFRVSFHRRQHQRPRDSFRSTRASVRQLIEPTPTQDHWHALFRPRCSGFCLLRR